MMLLMHAAAAVFSGPRLRHGVGDRPSSSSDCRIVNVFIFINHDVRQPPYQQQQLWVQCHVGLRAVHCSSPLDHVLVTITVLSK